MRGTRPPSDVTGTDVSLLLTTGGAGVAAEQYRYDSRPVTSRTRVIAGKRPWVTAARALSRAEINSTDAAAAMDPTPAKMSAAPTDLCPMATAAIPMPVTIA